MYIIIIHIINILLWLFICLIVTLIDLKVSLLTDVTKGLTVVGLSHGYQLILYL